MMSKSGKYASVLLTINGEGHIVPEDQLDFVVVIPARNESEGIGSTIDELRTALVGMNYEILVVDGHSTDRTSEIAREKSVKVINQKRLGYGDALRVGFIYVRNKMNAKAIVMMDADSTYDPSEIPELVEPILEDRADLVVGNRLAGLHDGVMSRLNRLGNAIISGVARFTMQVPIHDTQCGLRAFATDLVDCMSLEADGMPLALEMLVDAHNAKAKIIEMPISYRKRLGNSKLHPLRDGLRILGTILRLVRDTEPLLFFTAAATVLGVLGLFFGVNVTLEWLQTRTIDRLPTVMLAVLLLVASIQIFAIGLVADMLKRHRVTQRSMG